MTVNRITLDLGDIRITGTEVPGRPGMPLLVCLPGGGYNASYFDVAGYSLVDAARREGSACPGQAVARMEMTVAATELLKRLPDIHLGAGDIRHEFRGSETESISSLPAVFTPTS
jgi:hypothetical protein